MSDSWLALGCMRPVANHSQGILVAGIDMTADSMDPNYIHDAADNPHSGGARGRLLTNRVTDIYQFLQISYESLMLGVLSVHWSRQSVVCPLAVIRLPIMHSSADT